MADWLETLIGRAHEALATPAGAEARAYLASRGVTDDQIARFRLGFSDPELQIETCTQAFLDWYPKYWLNRLVFPLTDTKGTVIGLQTRALDRKFYQQFYAYSTEIYPFMFGLAPAVETLWATGHLIIVEGVFDCLSVARTTPNVVAVLTANVPASCRRFFRRYVTRLTALLDMDEAGRRGVERLTRDLERTYMVHAPVYPAHDPDDLVNSGRAAFLKGILRLSAST